MGALQDNVEVMLALNSGPVSLMLFTAKASTRMEAVVKQVEEYLERFIDFADLACILITHMDQEREWSEEQVTDTLNEHFGTIKVIFSGTSTTSSELCDSVNSQLATPRKFDIDSENFLLYFKICKKNLAIIRAIKKKVDEYKMDRHGWELQLGDWNEHEVRDQCFQFNTHMTARIPSLQAELSSEFEWDLATDKGAVTVDQQIGYVGYLAGQLRAELFSVRTILLNYHSNSEVTDLRKCPHCGEVWGKWEGCDGQTTCGERPAMRQEFRNNQQATFTFHPGSYVPGKSKYLVERTGQRQAAATNADGKGRGCGQTITWSTMSPVDSGTNKDGHTWTLADLNGTAPGGGMVVGAADVLPLPRGDDGVRGAGQITFDRLFEEAKLMAKSRSDDPSVCSRRKEMLLARAGA